MLEIFALEAEEHLQNISTNLNELEKNPRNEPALREIRRSSHTLKGAAGVIGFRTISQLAHRMEDLLDSLAENPSLSTTETTALLLSATDVLEALAKGENEQLYAPKIQTLYSRFADALEVKPIAQEVETKLAAAEIEVETTVAGHIETTNAETQPITLETAVVTPEAEHVSEAPEEEIAEKVEVHAEIIGKVNPRTVVRVSLERLDEVVKLIGELVISRSAIEQRLAELENQVEELHHSTGRLKRVASKLDIDFEASTLGGKSYNSKAFAPLLAAAVNAGPPTMFLPNADIKADFDDLEFDRYTEFHQMTRELVETSSDTAAVTTDLDELVGDLDTLLNRQRRLTDEMQEKLIGLRMVPFSSITPRLHRTVRVTADDEHKAADLYIEGESIEIDTQVLDTLAEPLLHLLRNAIGHGIELPETRRLLGKPERGSINLRVTHEGTHIVLTISDDGRGIDANKIREKAVRGGFISAEEAAHLTEEEARELIFLPGLTTAQKINEVSGRGVGMDIVRENITRQQGTISIKSTVQQGTTFIIRLPMSLALTRALIVKAYGQRFAFPLSVVRRIVETAPEHFDQLSQGKVLWVGDEFYPVSHLNEILQLPQMAEADETQNAALLLEFGESPAALLVDQIVEVREIVIKPLGSHLKKMRGMLGATILGDGSVIPILNLLELVERKGKPTGTAPAEKHHVLKYNIREQLSVMIVDDSPSVRRVMTNLIQSAGWTPVTVKDGLEALETLQVSRKLPDIILTDVEMPRMDGYELVASLKRQESFRDIPVVMITSRAGEKHRQKGFDLGVAEYVTKPYQDSVLLNTIQQLTHFAEV
jgi:chemosensory pili system protein ChpA (sensor histidine kinase/response regulator)